MLLLKHPEMVSSHGFIAMAAGIWFYMTPQDPKPSMHDVMTGNFIPNAVDL
jgi:chitinase